MLCATHVSAPTAFGPLDSHGQGWIMCAPDRESAAAAEAWQMLVAGEAQLPAPPLSASGVGQTTRMDPPHERLSQPALAKLQAATQWRAEVGWHCPATQAAGELAERGSLPALLAEAAHDLRGPLAAAQQALGLVLRRWQPGAAAAAEDRQWIAQAATRLAQAHHWADGILLEQRLQHRLPVAIRRRFYPHQWLMEMEPLLRALSEQYQVPLEWRGWDRSLPRLYLDPYHLSRIVTNLVTNALQASPATTARVRIGVTWLTDVTQHLVLTIEDDGRGMPDEVLQRLNTPGDQAPSGAGSEHQGMGLRTARALTRGMGGSLIAQRSHSGGMRMAVRLPVDNYHSLIRSWLMRHAELAARQPHDQRQQLRLFAVRCASPAHRPAAGQEPQLANQRDRVLHQAAGPQDFIYRVAHDRWLWLTLNAAGCHSQPPRGLDELGECRQQEVWRLDNIRLGASVGNISWQHHLLALTSRLAERMAELVGDHVPPVDDLTLPPVTGFVWDTRHASRRILRHERPPAGSAHLPATHLPATPLSAPHFSGGPSLAETPCETFSGALRELSQQWHVRQLQLDHAGRRLASAKSGALEV